MRATASNQQVALSMGISVKKMFALAWSISAIVSAVDTTTASPIICRS